MWFDCKQQSWSSGGSGMDRFWRFDVVGPQESRGKGKAMHRTRSESLSQQTGRAGLGLAWVAWWRVVAGS